MIDIVAVWGLHLLAAIAAAVWLTLPVPGKLRLAAAAVVAAVLVAVSVKAAGMVWADPRPFMVNPSINPTITHATDNGFVSDHATAAAMLAALIVPWRRWVGLAMLLGAVAIGWARVTDGVHHWPDVLGGLFIGLVCAAVGAVVANFGEAKFAPKSTAGSRPRPEITWTYPDPDQPSPGPVVVCRVFDLVICPLVGLELRTNVADERHN